MLNKKIKFAFWSPNSWKNPKFNLFLLTINCTKKKFNCFIKNSKNSSSVMQKIKAGKLWELSIIWWWEKKIMALETFWVSIPSKFSQSVESASRRPRLIWITKNKQFFWTEIKLWQTSNSKSVKNTHYTLKRLTYRLQKSQDHFTIIFIIRRL